MYLSCICIVGAVLQRWHDLTKKPYLVYPHIYSHLPLLGFIHVLDNGGLWGLVDVVARWMWTQRTYTFMFHCIMCTPSIFNNIPKSYLLVTWFLSLWWARYLWISGSNITNTNVINMSVFDYCIRNIIVHKHCVFMEDNTLCLLSYYIQIPELHIVLLPPPSAPCIIWGII